MKQTKFTHKAVRIFAPDPLQPAIRPLSTYSNFRKAAIDWYKFGYNVFPIISGTKHPALKWDPWLAILSKETINAYWQRNPKNELAFIPGDNLIVFDADSPESILALAEIEKAFDIKPNFIVRTTKGEHHHFKRAKGTQAKSDAHCTKKYPNRIDVKTGRALVILPPSTGKFILLNEAENADDLTEVGQDFINAISRHNGRNQLTTSISQNSAVACQTANSVNGYLGLKALLDRIDADCGYDDWVRVLMGIYHYTHGSDDGFDIANSWCGLGGKYKGEKEILAKWHSFNLNHPRPITIGTIMGMVENGFAIYTAAEEPFAFVAETAEGAQ